MTNQVKEIAKRFNDDRQTDERYGYLAALENNGWIDLISDNNLLTFIHPDFPGFIVDWLPDFKNPIVSKLGE